MIVGENIERFQIVALRAHCRCMAAGMTHSKLSKTRILELAGRVTGKTYKRGQHAQAAEDITEKLNET